MATLNFARCLATTLEFEGGYSNHPADPGGSTNMGITRKVLAEWRGSAVSAADVRALLRTEAAAIYRRRYWELCACDELPGGVDLVVFDYAVNSGVSRAVRALQQAVGVPVDGIAGHRTVAAARSADPRAVVADISARRRGFLRQLRVFTVFGRGWLRRIAMVEARALALAAANPPSSLPPQTKEPSAMTLTKSVLESRTFWSNLVGIGALAASLFGVDIGADAQAGIIDAALKIVAGASFVASTFFRVKATRAIS